MGMAWWRWAGKGPGSRLPLESLPAQTTLQFCDFPAFRSHLAHSNAPALQPVLGGLSPPHTPGPSPEELQDQLTGGPADPMSPQSSPIVPAVSPWPPESSSWQQVVAHMALSSARGCRGFLLTSSGFVALVL